MSFFFLEIVNKKLKNIPAISCAVECETDGKKTAKFFWILSEKRFPDRRKLYAAATKGKNGQIR